LPVPNGLKLACEQPSQPPIIEVFRRPLESAQYTSYAFGKRCQESGVMPSMGSVGDAYDNAMAESFFATLERELLGRRRFRSQAEAKMAVFEWIEGWYNPHRRHSGLGYRSPVNYERAHQRSVQIRRPELLPPAASDSPAV
jgi:putative transposase